MIKKYNSKLKKRKKSKNTLNIEKILKKKF